VTRRITHAKELARKPDAAFETVKSQLSKLGETIFNARSITIAVEQAFFLPIGVLNRLRRECLSDLEAERSKNLPRQTMSVVRNDTPYPRRRIDYTANVVNEKAAAFYRRHGVQEIEKGFELQQGACDKILMTTRYCLKFQFDLCKGEKGSAEVLFLSDGKTKYKLDFDCDQCMMKILAP
jgi:putative protease